MNWVSRILRHDPAQERALVVLNFTSFFLLARAGFAYWHLALFYGFDGAFEASVITKFVLHSNHVLNFSSDMLRGLGNIEYPIDALLIPGYVIAFHSWTGGGGNYIVAYSIFSLELFSATYLFGRFLGFPRMASLLASWILCLLTWQIAYFPPLVANTWRGLPHYAEILSIGLFIAAGYIWIGRKGFLMSAVISFGIFLAVTYITLATPQLLILVVPPIAVAGLVSMVLAETNRERIEKIAAAILLFAVWFGLGYFYYLAGLFGDTAAAVFKELSQRPHNLADISMLFWNPLHPLFRVERILVGGGIIGAFVGSIYAFGTLRIVAITTLVTELAYLTAGLTHYYIYPYWFGPAFWYFEGFLFPYLALTLAYLIVGVGRGLVHIYLLVNSNTRIARAANIWGATPAFALLAIVPWIYVAHAHWVTDRNGGPEPFFAAPYPQNETPITEILANEIRLNSGRPFLGRVAVLTGRIFPNYHNAYEEYGYTLDFSYMATGNYNETAGLWQYDIPTLTEYSQFMTPAYWAFMRNSFTDPDEVQIRNLVAMRHFDRRLMEVAGVRFIITDLPLSDAGTLRTVLHIPLSDKVRQAISLVKNIESFDLYLYELPHTNRGRYSPVEARVVPDAAELLVALADPGVDLAHTVLTQENLPAELVPAKFGDFRMEPNGMRVTASSPGVSVLLLPIEFSRCLSLETVPESDPDAHLFRADLVMTGITFRGRLDAKIRYHTGPFDNQSCRLHDSDDMKTMDMADAFRLRPAYAPRPRP